MLHMDFEVIALAERDMVICLVEEKTSFVNFLHNPGLDS